MKKHLLNEIKRDVWYEDAGIIVDRFFVEQSASNIIEVHPEYTAEPLTSYSWVLKRDGEHPAVVFDLRESSPARGRG